MTGLIVVHGFSVFISVVVDAIAGGSRYHPGVQILEIDPLRDPRWDSFVESHPHSSIFHTKEWLEALSRTYGYTPRAFITSPDEAVITGGIIFCQVNSWLTGSRLVSVPFSDHCDPLVQDPKDLHALLSAVEKIAIGRFKYAEIRPRLIAPELSSDWSVRSEYCFHIVDLRPSIEQLYAHFHTGCPR